MARRTASAARTATAQAGGTTLAISADCEAVDGCVPAYEAQNLSAWLNFQMSRWLIRTGRRGHWSIKAKISRGKDVPE